MVNTVNFERRVCGAAGKAQRERNDETLHLQLFPQTEALSCTLQGKREKVKS